MAIVLNASFGLAFSRQSSQMISFVWLLGCPTCVLSSLLVWSLRIDLYQFSFIRILHRILSKLFLIILVNRRWRTLKILLSNQWDFTKNLSHPDFRQVAVIIQLARVIWLKPLKSMARWRERRWEWLEFVVAIHLQKVALITFQNILHWSVSILENTATHHIQKINLQAVYARRFF